MTNKKSVDGPGTDQMPVVRPRPVPKDVKVDKSDVRHLVAQALLDAGEIPQFATNVLTAEMLRDVVVNNLSGGFFRTEAGYVQITCGLDKNDEITMHVTHWTSFNFAEDDHAYEVRVSLGALIPTRLPDVLPGVVEGELLSTKEIGK